MFEREKDTTPPSRCPHFSDPSPSAPAAAAAAAAATATATVDTTIDVLDPPADLPPIRTPPPPPPPAVVKTPTTPPLDLLREQAAAASLAARQLAALQGDPARVAELEALAASTRRALAAADSAANARAAAAASSAPLPPAAALVPLPPTLPPQLPPAPAAPLDVPALLATARASLTQDAQAAEARLLGRAAEAEAALVGAEKGGAPGEVDAAAAALADADGALEDFYAAALPPPARALLEAACTAAAVGGGEAAALFGPARTPLQARGRAAELAAHAARVGAALAAEASCAAPSAPRLAHLRRLRDATQAALWRVEGGAAAPPPAPLPPTPPRTPPPPPAPAPRPPTAAADAPPLPHPPGTLRLVAGAAAIPHPAKADTGGEDAHFTSPSGLGCVGVADGVGGWAAEGVDPAVFARRLMAGAAAALEAAPRQGGVGGGGGGPASPRPAPAPAACVRAALAAGHAATAGILGSSTAVLGAALPGGTLQVAVLGDSGFYLLRDGKVALASDPQQHSFNMPFQLADPGLGSAAANTPADADVYDVAGEVGDVLILATDGVCDNLYPAELEAVVAAWYGGGQAPPSTPASAASLARAIAAAAAAHGADPTYQSPWVVEAARAGVLPLWARFNPRGGKLDDCTVVVAWVVGA